MAAPPHASGDGHYQQRIWKVSKALDRLALMCEQHHRQTKHVDGLPDWTPPSMPAGVKTQGHEDAPANFAWTSSPVKTVVRDDRFVSPPVESVEETHSVPAVKTLYEEDPTVLDPYAKQSESLRAATRDMMSRLSLSSTDSFDIAGGQATHESVRPLSMAQPSKPSPKTVLPEPVLSEPVFSTTELTPTEPKPTSRIIMDSPRERRPVSESSPGRFFHQASPARAPQRHAMDPPRRRKVQFADHERSYRGTRSKRMSDLTYHEAMQALASQPSRDTPRSTGAPRTTYQETYQWPQRENLVSMLDKVGGQTAGGPTRYEPRRVFTAEDAMRVAKESAIDFRVGHDNAPQSPALLQPIQMTQELSAQSGDERQHPVIPSPTLETLDPPKFEARTASREPTHVPSRRGSGQLLAFDTPSVDTRLSTDERDRTTLQQTMSESKPLVADQRYATNDLEDFVRPRTPLQSCQNVATMTTPASVVDASTQTDRLKTIVKQKTIEHNPPSHHTGYCSHCGRSDNPPAVTNPEKPYPSAVARPDTGKTGPRARRPPSSSQRYNPIFANARFPPEPPVFRGKTTYSSEFGAKRSNRR